LVAATAVGEVPQAIATSVTAPVAPTAEVITALPKSFSVILSISP